MLAREGALKVLGPTVNVVAPRVHRLAPIHHRLGPRAHELEHAGRFEPARLGAGDKVGCHREDVLLVQVPECLDAAQVGVVGAFGEHGHQSVRPLAQRIAVYVVDFILLRLVAFGGESVLGARAPDVTLLHVPGHVLRDEAPEAGTLLRADWDAVLDGLKVGRDEALSCKGNGRIARRARRTDIRRLIEQLVEPLGSRKWVGIQERADALLGRIGRLPDEGLEAIFVLQVLAHVIERLVDLGVHLGLWVERLVAAGPVEHGRPSKHHRGIQFVQFQVGLRDVPEAVHEGRVAHKVIPALHLVRKRKVRDPESEREGRLRDETGFIVGVHVAVEDFGHLLRPPLGQVDARHSKVPSRLGGGEQLLAVEPLAPAHYRARKLILLADAVPVLHRLLGAPTVRVCLVLA